MPQYNPSNAEVLIFTFKDGLLSKVAHDLKLSVTRFSVDVDPSAPAIKAEFDPSSLRVLATVHDGKEDPKGLSDSDKEKIASQIQKDVLESAQHANVSFVSRSVARRPDGGYSISGELTLHGKARPLSVETRLDAGHQVAEIPLNQLDYGIVPFKAMMGTLKVKPEVRVRISVPNA
jgi:polyisoprenoid-binding protein YceI